MPDRRQKVTDDDVFAAAQRVMSRRGPHELTLADIATEAGLTPGRLVQLGLHGISTRCCQLT